MVDDSTSPRYELDGDVAVVTLDDGKANAIGPGVLAGLHAALDRAEDEASAVVLVGGARAFSAGFDLAVMTSHAEAMQDLVIAGGRLCMRLYGFGRPVVAACTGHALAAGALVLLSCDDRVGPAGVPAKIGLNEVAIGMPLPIYAVELARDRLHPAHLTRAALGEVYDPEGAVAAGYLDRTVPPDQVVAEALAVARRRAALRPGAVARTKAALRGRTIEHVLATLEDDVRGLTGPEGAS